MRAVTAEIMKRLDQKTIREFGIPGLVLMENAARGTLNALMRYFPDLPGQRIGILAGRGNNGGDALAVARYLWNRKIPCRTYLFAHQDELQGDAAANLKILTHMGAEVVEISDGQEWETRKGEVAENQLFVDGILGTGLRGPVRGYLPEVFQFLNALHRPVVAIDIPSGLDADSGQVLGACLQSSLTVTYGMVKRGLLVFPGAQLCGRWEVVDISIPEAAIEGEPIEDFLLEGADFLSWLPARKPDMHKGDCGHLFVLAGSPGKTGAAAMVCEAALRAGTGLITLGVPESLNSILEMKLTEPMTEPLPETRERTLALSAVGRIREMVSRMDALAIGPGLSRQVETAELVSRVLRDDLPPTVIDADGLNALAGNLDLLRKNRAKLILTPHPGELARMTEMAVPEIQKNRIQVARSFARQNGVILVLKGARSLVASPDGKVFINPTGNPGMASGGMGDVLTGIVGALLAQRIPPLEAAKLGVYLHGLVGDFVAFRQGERGCAASDLIQNTPRVLHALAAGENQIDDFTFEFKKEFVY
jgi:hydroxyethylthiazole kinase-like uncharacterized protein yjeF